MDLYSSPAGELPLSRVHELARLPLLDLIGIYNQLAERTPGAMQASGAMVGDKDRLIGAIRNLEDPR